METIKSAAVRDQRGKVHTLPPPAHHKHILKMLKDDGWPVKDITKGFLTSEGRFVGREQGGRIALRAQQATRLREFPDLHSGDMW
ncbi:MAG: hypothetical protein V4621_07955 [Pseudomonadota bacterium]